jgi:uncharacterized protein YabN with tetrapyrrole methylase and pyrophosphatase domain
MGKSPFQQVYGLEVVLPIQLDLPVMKLLHDVVSEPDKIRKTIHQLLEVQDKMNKIYDKFKGHHQRMERIFDKKAKPRGFQVGDVNPTWDKGMRC